MKDLHQLIEVAVETTVEARNELPEEEQLYLIRAIADDLQSMVDQLIAKRGIGNLSRTRTEWDLIDLNKELVKVTQILHRPSLSTYQEAVE